MLSFLLLLIVLIVVVRHLVHIALSHLNGHIIKVGLFFKSLESLYIGVVNEVGLHEFKDGFSLHGESADVHELSLSDVVLEALQVK